ncbi:MAG: hypothetical protein AAGJ18_06960, partial [Bacteroidota bacterium]
MLFSSWRWTSEPLYTTTLSFGTYKQFDVPLRFANKPLSNRRQKLINQWQVKKFSQQVAALATSSTIMEQLLFNKVTFQKSNDFLANHMIDSYELFVKEQLANTKQADLIDFRFQHGNLARFSSLEKRAFQRVYRLFKNKKKGILSANFDEKTQLIVLKAESKYPQLPALVLEVAYEEVVRFY